MNFFTDLELARYSKHFCLPEVGHEGQKKIKKTKILCIGAGGLGTSALFYLAAAGVGTLGIIDPDRVELSNLQRQILYTVADLGQLKVDIAQRRLHALNPEIHLTTYPVAITEQNALDIIKEYDLVIDATDNYATRYLINDACFHLRKPNIFAAIHGFSGQCTVFTLDDGPCYRCLFPEPPTIDFLPNCNEAGVLGALPGLLGNIQAIEALKLCLNIGNSLAGRLLKVNTLTFQWDEFKFLRNPDCLLCAKNMAFHELPRPAQLCQPISEITIAEFKQLQNDKKKIFLLDVRTQAEYIENNLGGYLIPLDELPQRLNELNPSDEIITYCQMGTRGKKAADILLKNGFRKVRNLAGGMSGFFATKHV